MESICSMPELFLVTWKAYSQCLSSYWSHGEHILNVWAPIDPGELLGICGAVGSGKSSLLGSLLQEMSLVRNVYILA
jgi:ABC-type phosphonate transport system ATPase subunit